MQNFNGSSQAQTSANSLNDIQNLGLNKGQRNNSDTGNKNLRNSQTQQTWINQWQQLEPLPIKTQEQQYIEDLCSELQQPPQESQKQNVKRIITNLVDKKMAQSALQELQLQFLSAHPSYKYDTINEFVKQIIEYLADENIADQQCDDGLNFMELSQTSEVLEQLPDFNSNGDFFRSFNHQLRDQIKQSLVDIRRLCRLCLVRAIGINFGVFDFCEVVTEILDEYLKIELGFDFFYGGLVYLAKLIMEDLDDHFKEANLHIQVLEALQNSELKQFSNQERYEDFMKLLEHTTSRLEDFL
eukprot:TRINITY_DN17947_c0_g1_i3.p1 TRINITY_DN17947_c0_g1~~TRINITY_DN17947_c0_g1_i3.p1  ORF type:complete len:299 (-),score=31.94 TRINITY_DN17947_c0_g1_i3:242-1138(-)